MAKSLAVIKLITYIQLSSDVGVNTTAATAAIKSGLIRKRSGNKRAENVETMSVSREYRDSWFEVGFGTNIHLSKASYFYGDREKLWRGYREEMADQCRRKI